MKAVARVEPQVGVAVGAVSVSLLGGGLIVAAAGAAANSSLLAVTGAGVAMSALLVLMAAGLIDDLMVLAGALPLPALVASQQARVSPAVVLTALVLVGWALRAVDRRRALGVVWFPWKSSLGLLTAMTLSALVGRSFAAAGRELINWTLMLGLLYLALNELPRDTARPRRLALVIAGVVGMSGAAAVFQSIGVLPGRFSLPGTAFFRATLGFGWPNELGMFMAIGLPLTIYAYATARTQSMKAVAAAAVVAAVCGLAVTFSRGSWLGVAAAAPVVLLSARRRPRWQLIGMIVGGTILLDLVTGGALRTRIVSTTGDPLVGQRAALMYAGVVMFLEHPFLGVGPGSFGLALQDFGPQISWLWDYVGSAHNMYLEMAAELGIIGLAAFLALLGTLWLVLWKNARQAVTDPHVSADELGLRNAVLWAYTTACMVGMSGWPFAHGVGQLIVLVAAIGIVVPRSAR